MRTLLICCLLLIFSAALFQAQELPKQNEDQAIATKDSSGSDPSDSQFEHLRIRPGENLQTLDAHAAEEFCAFIRAYRVRREYKGSDVVAPAGYTTCVRSSRFEIRSAVMTESSAGK